MCMQTEMNVQLTKIKINANSMHFESNLKFIQIGCKIGCIFAANTSVMSAIPQKRIRVDSRTILLSLNSIFFVQIRTVFTIETSAISIGCIFQIIFELLK